MILSLSLCLFYLGCVLLYLRCFPVQDNTVLYNRTVTLEQDIRNLRSDHNKEMADQYNELTKTINDLERQAQNKRGKWESSWYGSGSSWKQSGSWSWASSSVDASSWTAPWASSSAEASSWTAPWTSSSVEASSWKQQWTSSSADASSWTPPPSSSTDDTAGKSVTLTLSELKELMKRDAPDTKKGDDDEPKTKKPKAYRCTPCNYFLAGRCARGADCTFLHPDVLTGASNLNNFGGMLMPFGFGGKGQL